VNFARATWLLQLEAMVESYVVKTRIKSSRYQMYSIPSSHIVDNGYRAPNCIALMNASTAYAVIDEKIDSMTDLPKAAGLRYRVCGTFDGPDGLARHSGKGTRKVASIAARKIRISQVKHRNVGRSKRLSGNVHFRYEQVQF